MNNRRTNIEIIADILRMGEASKTQIMYNVGMSYAQLEKYLEYLIERNFLTHTTHKYPAGTYKISQDGELLLKSIDRIQELLDLDIDETLKAETSRRAFKADKDVEEEIGNKGRYSGFKR